MRYDKIIPTTLVVGFTCVIVEKTSSFNFWQRNEYLSIFSALFAQSVHMVLFLAAYVDPPWLSTIMSSICYQAIGSFTDIPALIHVEDVSPYPSVLLSFLHSCNVPRSVSDYNGVAVESSSGPVCVLTVDGWYNSRQTFLSVYLNGCDVKLGRD